MPSTCCVLGCKSNYTGIGEKETVSIFKFPKDKKRKELWLRKISRDNFAPGKYTRVCVKHFSEQFIIRVDTAKRPDGTILSVPRPKPKLTDDAFPSLFPKCPEYLSPEPPAKRKKPDERRLEAEQRDESNFKKTMRKGNASSNRSYPASRWKSGRKIADSSITLNMECYEEPLSYSQFQAAKAAKVEYNKNQLIIAAAKDGRLVFMDDGNTRILDKPFAEVPEIIELGKYKPPPPRQSIPIPRYSPPPTLSPTNLVVPVGHRSAVPKSGRDSPDIIFVGETPPKNFSPVVPITPVSLSSPQNVSQTAKKASAQKSKDSSPSINLPSPAIPTSNPISKLQSDAIAAVKKATQKRVSHNTANTTTANTTTANTATANTNIAKTPVGPNWVPLDEYYYGKMEGNPAYLETKGEFRFKCFQCTKMLYNNVAAMLHIQGHIDTEKQVNLDISDLTQCKHCFKQFDTPFEMQTHIERVHMNNANVLLCRICEKDHNSRGTLTEHMRRSHNSCEMPYICHLCNFRSSMYSDVVDHFKKKHCSSQYLLCLYCLRTFSSRIVSQGYGQTNVFYNHVLKHQMKNSTKKCQYCKLIFLNSADLKEHRKNDHLPNQKRAIGSSKHQSAPDQVMIKVATETKDSGSKQGLAFGSGGGVKSLNVPTIKKVVEQKIVFSANKINKSKCIECGNPYAKDDHFSKYIQCSLCRFATSCSFAYANHMMGFHSGQQVASSAMRSAVERRLPGPMYCMCGFNSLFGNVIATHLVSCSKTSCSTEQPPPSQNIPLDEFGRKMKDPRKKPGASLLDVLGLVKKDSIQSSKVRRTESPPPPVDMPEVSVSDPPPRRPSLLRDSMKKPSFKTVLSASLELKSSDDNSNQDRWSSGTPTTPDSASFDSTEKAYETSSKKVAEEKETLKRGVTKDPFDDVMDDMSDSKAKRLKLSAKVVLSEDGNAIEDGTKSAFKLEEDMLKDVEKEKDEEKNDSKEEDAEMIGSVRDGGDDVNEDVKSGEEKSHQVSQIASGEDDRGDAKMVHVSAMESEENDSGCAKSDQVSEIENGKKEICEENTSDVKMTNDDHSVEDEKEKKMDVDIGEEGKDEVGQMSGDVKKTDIELEKDCEMISKEEEEEKELLGCEEEDDAEKEKDKLSSGGVLDTDATLKQDGDDIGDKAESNERIEGDEEEKVISYTEEDGARNNVDDDFNIEKHNEINVKDGESVEELGQDVCVKDDDVLGEDNEAVKDVSQDEKENEKVESESANLQTDENVNDVIDDCLVKEKEDIVADSTVDNVDHKSGNNGDDDKLDDMSDDDGEGKDEGGDEEALGKKEESIHVEAVDADERMDNVDHKKGDNGDDDKLDDVSDDELMDDDGEGKDKGGDEEDVGKKEESIHVGTVDADEERMVENVADREDNDVDNNNDNSMEDEGMSESALNKESVEGEKEVKKNNNSDEDIEEADNENDDADDDILRQEDDKSETEKTTVHNENESESNENDSKDQYVENKDEISSTSAPENSSPNQSDKDGAISTEIPSTMSENQNPSLESQGKEEITKSTEEGIENFTQDVTTVSNNDSTEISRVIQQAETVSSTEHQFDPSAIDAIGATTASSFSSTSVAVTSSSSSSSVSREPGSGGDYSRSRDRSRSTDRDRDRERDRERYRDRDRDRHRDRDYHHRDRDRYYDRDRYRDDDRRRDRGGDRDRDHYHRDYDYDRNRDRDRHRDRDRYHRDRDYYKHRDDRHYYR